MAYEVAEFIWQLDRTLPEKHDPIGEAKDHIFAIKNSLLNTFPKFDKGSGTADNFLTFSSDELNDMAEIFKLNTTGTPPNETIVSAEIDGQIKLTGYPSEYKYMYLKFDPVAGVPKVPAVTGASGVYNKLELAQPTVPLGSIMVSPLSKIQVDNIFGTGTFLLCDGVATIPSTSLLLKVFPGKFTKVPDYRNRIITQATNNITPPPGTPDLGFLFEPKTKWVPGVDFNLDAVSYDYHDHYGFGHYHSMPNTSTYVVEGSNLTVNGYDSIGLRAPGYTKPKFYSSNDNAIKVSSAHTHNIDFSAMYQGNNLPNRVLMNFYMRVN